jgi:hypothetical protein
VDYLEVTADCTARTLAVNANGTSSRDEIKLGPLLFRTDPTGPFQTASCSGTVIEHNCSVGIPFVRKDGLPISDAEVAALKSVFGQHADERHPSNDDVFGTTKLVRAGDTWSGHNAVLAKEASKLFRAQIAPTSVSSWVKVNGTQVVGSVECVDVSTHVTISNLHRSPGFASMHANNVEMTTDDRTLYPKNPKMPSLASRSVNHFLIIKTDSKGRREMDEEESTEINPIAPVE